MQRGSDSAPEDERRYVERGQGVICKSGHGRARLGAIDEHPSLEGRDELPRVECQEQLALSTFSRFFRLRFW